jgi:type I restriction enzyme S subunit
MTGVRKEAVVGHVPACWGIKPLAEVSDFITKGGTPTTYGFDWADESNGIPFFRSECVTDEGFNPKGMNFIPVEAHHQMSRSEIKPGDLLMTITGYVGRVAKASERFPTANINQHIARIRVLSEACADADFVYQCLKHQAYATYYRAILTGQAYPQISLEQVRGTPVAFPPLPEQKKIAAILTALDDKLGVIARQIEATHALKRGLIQILFSGGVGTQDANGIWIPHSEFKDSELGAIPTLWSVKEIGEALSVVERPLKMADDQLYRRVTVRRRHGGVDLRDELPGAGIKVKNQYLLEAGDFLISERQIVHGACGIVPEHLAGALVSNEYLVLKAREGFDVTYFSYLVQLLKYAKLFLVCSQGVDIEKFLFKPRDWLKKPIPVPPLAEQQRIAEILATIEEKTNALQRKQSDYQKLKRGLMQKLLTGEWRVKLDSPTGAA